MCLDISNEISGGDLDEKIDFQSVIVFKFITHNILSFEIESLENLYQSLPHLYKFLKIIDLSGSFNFEINSKFNSTPHTPV